MVSILLISRWKSKQLWTCKDVLLVLRFVFMTFIYILYPWTYLLCMFYCNIFSQFICMLCLYVFCFINFSLFECIRFHIVLVVLRGKAFYVPSWLGVYSFFELIKFVLVPSRFLYLTNQHIFMILFSNINNYIQIIYHKFYYKFFKVLQIL